MAWVVLLLPKRTQWHHPFCPLAVHQVSHYLQNSCAYNRMGAASLLHYLYTCIFESLHRNQNDTEVWVTRAPETITVCASRAFSVCAPVVWNSLSTDLHLCDCLIPFKARLKTVFYFVVNICCTWYEFRIKFTDLRCLINWPVVFKGLWMFRLHGAAKIKVNDWKASIYCTP